MIRNITIYFQGQRLIMEHIKKERIKIFIDQSLMLRWNSQNNTHVRKKWYTGNIDAIQKDTDNIIRIHDIKWDLQLRPQKTKIITYSRLNCWLLKPDSSWLVWEFSLISITLNFVGKKWKFNIKYTISKTELIKLNSNQRPHHLPDSFLMHY